MTLAELFPLLGSEKSTKKSIISALSEEWPLSAQQIYKKVTEHHPKPVTYQAIHKVLNQLIDEHILAKQNQVYQLNPQWITQIKNFGQTVDHVYSNETGKLKIKDFSSPVKIEFRDASTLPVTLANLFASTTFTNGQPLPVYGLFKHGIWPLRFNFLDFDLLLRMTKRNGGYAAIIGTTPFDQWIAAHYRAGGIQKAKTGVNAEISEDAIFAQGDSVIQVNYSPETAKLIEELYQEINGLHDLFKIYG